MRLPVLVLTMIIGAWMALAAHAQDGADPVLPPRPVVSEIIGGTSEEMRSYIGTVTARIEVNLGFPVSGTMASRTANLGDTVARGDAIAQLDPEVLEAGAWAARAGVVVADQQLNSASAVLERERTLVARGVESKTRQEEAERAFAAATARLEQAEATLVRAEDTLNSATLRAPIDGVITETLVEAGTTVSAGQPIVQLAGIKDREVVVDLSETDLAQLPRKVEFGANLLAVPNARATVRLQSIDPVADRRTRTRRVHFSLTKPPAVFRIGALVRVIPPRNTIRIITVPTSAILTGPDGTATVWVATRPADIVHSVIVTADRTLGERTIIIAGLEVGQEIIIKGVHSLKDGQTVGPRVTK